MVARVSSNAGLPAKSVEAVVKRTTGVPLFIEELTRSLLERGALDTEHEIPATLHDLLMARLDRLGPAREIAQTASVIGREFSYELLAAVAGTPEDGLQSALAKLSEAELIYARGIPPEANYQFKHALIQDAAYEALLKSRRRELHRRVAQTISERFAAVAEAQPQVLARHWTGAGEAEPAIAAWTKAAEAAEARGALKEAEEGCRQALAMLNTLPESTERDARALGLVSVLSSVLQRSRGYVAPETIEVLEHARALAEKTGNLAQLVVRGTAAWAAVYVSGDYTSAGALADQILDLAQREGSHTSLGFAHFAQLSVRFYRGDLIGVEEHFARFRGFLDAAGLVRQPDAITNGIGYASIGVWMLGHSHSARERMAQAIAFARDYKNPYPLATGRSVEAYLYRWLREPRLAADAATQSIAISEEHGFSFYRSQTRIILGWATAQLGQPAKGVTLIRQGLAGQVETGSRADITNTIGMLAEAQALGGAIDDALITLDEALQANPEELVFRPNILRFRGELRLRLGQPEIAESDFREAIALAKEMSAK
jgi:tetratricopeptide (TPR) repeat protein